MKLSNRSIAWPLASTIAIVVAPAVQAQVITVTDVRLESVNGELQLILETPPGFEPQPLQVETGNTLAIEIPNARLELPSGESSFRRSNPAPGIASIAVELGDDNNLLIFIAGTESVPQVQIQEGDTGVVVAITETPVAETPAEAADPIELVVTATRTEEELANIPRAVTVIPREEIEDQSLLTNDLSGILGTLVPGFGPPNPENRTRAQSLRGRSALILIDGIPQNSNTNFASELSSIDPAAVERIEVVRGPSAVFGDGATGGIVNIITRPTVEEGFEQTAAIQLGSDLNNLDEVSLGFNGRYGFSGRAGQFDYRLLGSFDSEPTHFDANGERIPPDGLSTDSRTLDVLAKAGLDIAENQRLQFTYNVFNNDFESDFIAVPDERADQILLVGGDQAADALEIGEIDFDDAPGQTVQNLALTYRNEAIIGSQLDLQLYYRETDLTQIPVDIRGLFAPGAFPAAPQIFQTNLDASELGARLQIDSPFSEAVSLLWGVDFAREENETFFNSIDPDAFEAGAAEVIDTATQAPFYTLESVGLFAQLRWDITDRLLFRGGARFEAIDADVDDYTASPFSNPAGAPAQIEGGSINEEDVVFNAGLVFDATANVSLFANFSQGFSIPALGFTLGTANFGTRVEDAIELEAQQVDNYELGIRGNWRDVEVSLAGFFNESELGSTLIVIDGLTEPVRAPQRNYGLEFSLDWTPSDRWRVGGILTWNEGEFDSDDDGDFDALSSIDVQPLNLTLYLENETLPGWRNRIQALIVSGRDRAFEDGVDEFEVNGYTIFDFVSSLALGPGRLELAIGNLFDEDYLPVSSQERFAAQANDRFAGRGRYLNLRYQIEF